MVLMLVERMFPVRVVRVVPMPVALMRMSMPVMGVRVRVSVMIGLRGTIRPSRRS